MSDIVLLRPLWLVALPLLCVLAVIVWRQKQGAGGWQHVIEPALLAGLQELGFLAASNQKGRAIAATSAIFLIVLGLTGPAIQRPNAPIFAQTDAILIAMDTSPSITQGPALQIAQSAAAQILAETAGRPVGLILYSGEAFQVAAPTSDPRTLETLIAVITPQTMPGDGSRPASAISMAATTLKGLKRADLILISDGGGVDQDAIAEADRLRASGIRISALFVDRPSIKAPTADESALRKLVGRNFAPAQNPESVLQSLQAVGRTAQDATLTTLHYRDLGPFVAALAAFPMLFLFWRHA